ncbi:head-tail connector protein [Superficieibacter sp. 1612_C1]|uniref:head-tail connector protein n=1 Tax=Superficieibacter sp. 1612_C1 TaxID=2780382 RepID=UPI001883DE27|nr:head-tail connector protein [Superficieibacter sp. 1612_C1]
MTVVRIETALEHLRLDEDTDKAMVEIYLCAAEDAAMQFLNRQFYADETTLASAVLSGKAGEKPMIIMPSVESAVLLILGWLYESRGDDPGGDFPKSARWLLNPWRVDMGV